MSEFLYFLCLGVVCRVYTSQLYGLVPKSSATWLYFYQQFIRSLIVPDRSAPRDKEPNLGHRECGCRHNSKVQWSVASPQLLGQPP